MLRVPDTISAAEGEDRDLACTYSPYKFYALLAFAIAIATLLASKGFRFVTIISQHVRWIS
jgi:hypothetical protein